MTVLAAPPAQKDKYINAEFNIEVKPRAQTECTFGSNDQAKIVLPGLSAKHVNVVQHFKRIRCCNLDNSTVTEVYNGEKEV